MYFKRVCVGKEKLFVRLMVDSQASIKLTKLPLPFFSKPHASEADDLYQEDEMI